MDPFALEPVAAVYSLIRTGGNVLWIILGVTIILWTMILERYLLYYWVFPRRTVAWIEDWKGRRDHSSWYARRIRDATISRARAQLGSTLPVITTLVAICPLCGLLGTVTGMIEVFDVMALKGTSDARAMASGVFRATIPTMAGMIVALSGLYFGTRFRHLIKVEVERIGDHMHFTDSPEVAS